MANNECYIVLRNGSGQYSLWPKKKNVPEGWEVDGFEGSRDDCIKHVDEVWLDMRPRYVA